MGLRELSDAGFKSGCDLCGGGGQGVGSSVNEARGGSATCDYARPTVLGEGCEAAEQEKGQRHDDDGG